MKKIVSLLLIAFCFSTVLSCKFIKKKFGKKEEVVVDSTLTSDGEFADGSTSDLSDADLLSDSSTGSSSQAGSSTDALAASSGESNSNTSHAGTKENANQAAHATAKAAAKSGKSMNNSNALVAPDPPQRPHKGRSASIYDGINDQEERAVIRRAEGYIDGGYVDDYNGSNRSYEQHYKKASELDGSSDYIVPASGYADGHQASMPRRGKALPNTPSHSQPVARPSDAKANGGSGNGQIGTVPTKVDQKPKSANDIIQKK